MQHIGSGLQNIAAQLLKSLPEDERVVAAWPHVCGAAVAARAHASRYENGVLHIAVAGREWSELGGLSGQYLAKLRQLTEVHVERLSFDL